MIASIFAKLWQREPGAEGGGSAAKQVRGSMQNNDRVGNHEEHPHAGVSSWDGW
jgi:hypothetical protein